MSFSSQWLEELKSRISLSGLIMRTVRLTRAGHEWKACCPFHHEKSPSFYVNDQKGFYHCFGCHQHGGAIDWMIEHHGLSFLDAVKELAAGAGMDLPEPDPRLVRQARQRASLHDALQAAQEWFVSCLDGPPGAAARDYLGRRGIDDRRRHEFGFGFAPADRQAMARALAGFDEALLIEAGLLIKPDGQPAYARFRDRLMLPIQDARGRVIAFGGRILEAREGAAKYLNSPDTPLFDKGRNLYNLHRAAPASRQAGRLIVVEGYLDVVALAGAGIGEAVAPMGTALGEPQLALAWRLADKPIVCLDGDGAGRRAAMRAAARALPLLQPGLSLRFATLPAGVDPDDLVRAGGTAAIEQVLAGACSLLDLIWAHEAEAQPLSSPEDKAGLKARLIAHVETIAHPDIRALYRRELLDRFGAFAYPPRAPSARWEGARGPQHGARSPKGASSGAGPRFGVRPGAPDLAPPEAAARLRRAASGAFRDTLALAVLHGLRRHADQIARHEENLLRLAASDPALAPAIEALLDGAGQVDGGGGLEPGEKQAMFPLADLPPPPATLWYSFLDEGGAPDEAREDLAEAVALLVERPALDAAMRAAGARFAFDPEAAFAEQQRLRKRKLEIEQRLGQMARKRAAAAALDDDIEPD